MTVVRSGRERVTAPARAERRALTALARAYGVQLSYTDDRAQRQSASTEALLGALRARGVPIDSPRKARAALRTRRAQLEQQVLPPVVVAWNGRMPELRIRLPRGIRSARFRLETEDGDARVWEAGAHGRGISVRVRDVLPPGRHRLRVETGNACHDTWILAAPRHAYDPSARQWGVFAPVYAMAPDGACHGGYRELHDLASAMRAYGADLVATLPVLATFLDAPCEPSPYAPASRLFWNELYVDAAALGAQPDEAQNRMLRACAAADHIDYAAAAAVQRALLQPLADRALGEHGDAYARDFAARADVADYARFRAVCDRRREPWPQWPARLRDGRIRSDDFDSADLRYHAFAQFAAERQIAAIAHDPAAAALYLDMPLGVHPHGYDTWRHRSLFAPGASAGAPPDALFRGGQDWGFPPMDPDALRADGYSYVIATLRHQLRHARVLRLDHVMALYRLYWIPHGLPATDGVYIRYAEDEMFAVLTLESARHHAAIVGEDLGTVPAAVRRRLDRHAIQRMFVVQYEIGADRDPPIGTPPARSAASLNTHDMPTFAGFWHGRDIADLRDLSLVDEGGERAAHAERARLRSVLARHLRLSQNAVRADVPGAALDALLDRLAGGPANTVIVGLEDLWLEDRPQNVPGTGPAQRPNWRRRFRYPFPDVLRRPEVRARLQRIAAARPRGEHMQQEQE